MTPATVSRTNRTRGPDTRMTATPARPGAEDKATIVGCVSDAAVAAMGFMSCFVSWAAEAPPLPQRGESRNRKRPLLATSHCAGGATDLLKGYELARQVDRRCGEGHPGRFRTSNLIAADNRYGIESMKMATPRDLLGPNEIRRRTNRTQAIGTAANRSHRVRVSRQVFIESKNSEFCLVCRSLSMRNSIASCGPIGLRMRRST